MEQKRNILGEKITAKVKNPDKVFSVTDGVDRIKLLQLTPISADVPRYDDISENDGSTRMNIHNLTNFFRGISILAMFIGLFSFFLGFSYLFDDLFVLCQLIFVHIFIQSPWLAATFKLPISGMYLVQFMAWLPAEARAPIERSIYSQPDYYQRSPIVYEQYWTDINFIRAIYHTLIFLAAMAVFYLLLRIINSIYRPQLLNILSAKQRQPGLVSRHYFSLIKRKMVFIDRILRFTFFTVVWAANLQFIYFSSRPTSIRAGSQAICIICFVVFILAVVAIQIYLYRKAESLRVVSFESAYEGMRLRHGKIIYYFWPYLKLLIIATLVAQLYKANPLAVLIPLVLIHIADAVLLYVYRPYLTDDIQDEEEKILSQCSKRYWTAYWIAAIIQSALFAILEIVIIIMYGTRSAASTATYFSTGYAACAFVVLLLINGLVRLGWGIIKAFEVCSEDMNMEEHGIKSEVENRPFNEAFALLENEQEENAEYPPAVSQMYARQGQKRPSIEAGFGGFAN